MLYSSGFAKGLVSCHYPFHLFFILYLTKELFRNSIDSLIISILEVPLPVEIWYEVPGLIRVSCRYMFHKALAVTKVFINLV